MLPFHPRPVVPSENSLKSSKSKWKLDVQCTLYTHLRTMCTFGHEYWWKLGFEHHGCRNTDLKVKRYLRHASVSASCSVNHSSKSSTSDFKMFSIKNMIRHEAFFKEMIAFHAESFLVSFYEVVLVDISPSFRDIFIFLIISFPAKNSEFSHLRAISPLAIHLCDLHLQNIAHLPHTPLQLRQKLMCVSKSL